MSKITSTIFLRATGRLAEWALEFIEYDYKIAYRKVSAKVLDALSRMNETEKSVASILSCSLENECEEFVDETNELHKTKFRQVKRKT